MSSKQKIFSCLERYFDTSREVACPLDHDLFKQSLTGLSDGIWPFFWLIWVVYSDWVGNLMMFLYWGIWADSAPKHVTSCQHPSHQWLKPLQIEVIAIFSSFSPLFPSVIQYDPGISLVRWYIMRWVGSKSLYAWPHTSYPHTWISSEIFSKTHLSLCWYL